MKNNFCCCQDYSVGAVSDCMRLELEKVRVPQTGTEPDYGNATPAGLLVKECMGGLHEPAVWPQGGGKVWLSSGLEG